MTQSPGRPTSKLPPRWVLIVVGLLAIHAGCMLIAVWIATREGSGAIPDYYQKAINWDRSHAQTRESAKH
ncbi:MAG: FixH family protein [Tepidisphaerales bacterium]